MMARGYVCDLRGDRRKAATENADMSEFERNIPHYLKEWRKFRRMTQQDLADAVGTTKAVIGLIENGDRGLSDKWARRLAPALNTSPGYILDHDPENLPTSILDIWADIPAEDRPQAERVLQAFRRTGTKG